LMHLIKFSPRSKFVTRSIRILDHLWGFYRPMRSAFGEVSNIESFVHRLSAEVSACAEMCRASQIGEMLSDVSTSVVAEAASSMDVDHATTGGDSLDATKNLTACPPERKSLIKGLLRLLISIASEPSAQTNIRNMVESSFTSVLERIVRNPAFFGTSIWTMSCKFVIDFLNAEPNMLGVLQDSGISQAFLDVLQTKIPASAEVLNDLPNLLASLCLNDRGLAFFVTTNPIDKLLPIFLLPEYLPCLSGDTASNLGAAMEELFRHQPSLRVAGLRSVTTLVDRLVALGSDAANTFVIGIF
jgi:hypothetical protein